MKIIIELLSDLCSYSGEIFNTQVDMDVCYDAYGLPYIPARRIKGCIREAALELVEFRYLKEAEYKKIFGESGTLKSVFTLSNAMLEDYKEIVSDLSLLEGDILVHPQNVLNEYTYIRTQTSMEDGVAQRNSLRTMRVVKKGVIFEAELKLPEQYKEIFKTVLGCVKHMGLSRTRGLGLVHLTLDEHNEDKNNDHQKEKTYFEKNKIPYTIKLDSPMIVKDADYIEGSKMLGVLIGAIGYEKYCELIKKDEIIVSNAYIENTGKRCVPASSSLAKRKDQKFENGEMKVLDRLSEYQGNEQLSSVGSIYIDEDRVVKNVSKRIDYHHRRPEDKSIGRASEGNDSEFYQLESICEGQVFAGYILADKEAAEVVGKALETIRNLRMGYSRNTEYGDVQLSIGEARELQKSEPNLCRQFVVKLNAPAIIYNDYGMVSTQVEDLVACLKASLGIDVYLEKASLKYKTLGGFNTTWHRRKPSIQVFDQGTVLLLETAEKNNVDVSVLEDIHIGERVFEGYGEIQILEAPADDVADGGYSYILKTNEGEMKATASKDAAALPAKTEILSSLARRSVLRELENLGRRKAGELYHNQQDIGPTISKLTLMCKEQKTYDGFKEQIKGIESNSKRKLAEDMLVYSDETLYGCRDYPYVSEKDISVDDGYQIYMSALLNQMKYLARPDKRAAKGGNEDE